MPARFDARWAGLSAALALACLPAWALGQTGSLLPHSTIYIALVEPDTSEAKTQIQQWHSHIANDLVAYLAGLNVTYANASQIDIVPQTVSWLSTPPTEVAADSMLRENDSLQVASFWGYKGTKSISIRTVVYLGDLKGPLSRKAVAFEQTVGANGYPTAIRAIKYLTVYAIANDARRISKRKAACSLLVEAERLDTPAFDHLVVTEDRLSLKEVRAAISKSKGDLAC